MPRIYLEAQKVLILVHNFITLLHELFFMNVIFSSGKTIFAFKFVLNRFSELEFPINRKLSFGLLRTLRAFCDYEEGKALQDVLVVQILMTLYHCSFATLQVS